MSSEESVRFLGCVLWNAGVPTHVRVQRFVVRAERLEELQSHIPVVTFIVPLEKYVNRNCHSSSLFQNGAGYEAAGEECGSRDPGIGCRESNSDGDDPPA